MQDANQTLETQGVGPTQEEIDEQIRDRLKAANDLAGKMCEGTCFERHGSVNAVELPDGRIAASLMLKHRTQGWYTNTMAVIHVPNTAVGPVTVSEEAVLRGVANGIECALADAQGKRLAKFEVVGMVGRFAKQAKAWAIDVHLDAAKQLQPGQMLKVANQTAHVFQVNRDSGRVHVRGPSLRKGQRAKVEFEALVSE